MTVKTINWLIIFSLFSLVGCLSTLETPSATPAMLVPTKQIALPTPTMYPTITPDPCSPYLETELPNPDIPENYLGKVFKLYYPEELKLEFEGSVLGDNDAGTNYLLALRTNKTTGQKMFWLERKLCTDSQRHTFYEIIDVVVIDYDQEKQEMVAPSSCWLNKTFDPEIFALGDSLPYTEKLQNITQAWMVNEQTEKIEEISTDGIECNRYSGISAP